LAFDSNQGHLLLLSRNARAELMILTSDEIARQAQPLPRDWVRLIQKLQWIGLDHEAARLELAVSIPPLEQSA
jgi:hypothetical protein